MKGKQLISTNACALSKAKHSFPVYLLSSSI